jgi:hypothetical protein
MRLGKHADAKDPATPVPKAGLLIARGFPHRNRSGECRNAAMGREVVKSLLTAHPDECPEVIIAVTFVGHPS